MSYYYSHFQTEVCLTRLFYRGYQKFCNEIRWQQYVTPIIKRIKDFLFTKFQQ